MRFDNPPPIQPLGEMFQPLPFVTRLTFKASDRPEAQEAMERLRARYGDVGDESAQVIVAWAATASCWRPCTTPCSARRRSTA
jgi:hypothetical protein